MRVDDAGKARAIPQPVRSLPEEIHFQHPNLSLAQIHGALTYYYENQDKVDEQIRRGLEDSDKLASHLSNAEFRHKLGNLKRSL